MKNIIIAALVASISLVACTNESTNSKSDSTSTDSTSVVDSTSCSADSTCVDPNKAK